MRPRDTTTVAAGLDDTGCPHPLAYGAMTRFPEYRTGLELSRMDEAERRPAGEGSTYHGIPDRPWGWESGAAGLTETYLRYLAEVGEDVDRPSDIAGSAYCTEQFVRRHAEDGGRRAIAGRGGRRPSRGTSLRDAFGGSCTFVALDAPLASPWPGHPYVGAYVDPRPGLGSSDEPGFGLLLTTRVTRGQGFWPLYRALNRAVSVWGERDTCASELLDGLRGCALDGPVTAPETLLALSEVLGAVTGRVTRAT